MKLQNQVALITGAASGLGKAQALLFAKEGAKIIAADMNLEGAQKTADEILNSGGDALAIQVDVTDAEHAEKAVKQALEKFGKISILSNTAGIFDQYAPLLDTSYDQWKKCFDINVDGIFNITKAVLPNMLEHKYGVVISISSGAGLIGGGGGIGYTTSKHGVIGFAKQLNADYGLQGIRSNVIAPGLIETPMVQKMIDDPEGGIMATLKKIPAGRQGQASEIADAALFLASDDSRYIYGAVLPVDGGLLSTLR